MSELRNHVLREVAKLDLKELQTLEPVLEALLRSRPAPSAATGRGAARSREALSSLTTRLSDAVTADRADRL